MRTFVLLYFLIYPLLCFAPITVQNDKWEGNMSPSLLDKDFIKGAVEYKQELERAYRIMKAFRIIESGNNYSILGMSGEYGAYQFTKGTWEKICLKHFNEILDITIKENQDEVAKKAILELIWKGYSDEQIASIWNCGSSQWKGKIGVNKYGVKYNVPAHIQKFSNTLSTLSSNQYV